MKIAIIGYGKMGKEIEQIAQGRGHEVVARITSSNPITGKSDFNNADCAIEFSRPENAIDNIEHCINAGVPVVVGTTGWYNKFETIADKIKTHQACLFYATNFSLGVNLFWKANQELAKMMNNYPNYEVELEEIHHTQKLDAPSGTAITTAEKIIENLDRKSSWSLDKPNGDDELNIVAKREPNVPGTHEVFYTSEIDTISIKHEAHNRKGFALGSVLAAEFIENKTGVYTMQNLLNF